MLPGSDRGALMNFGSCSVVHAKGSIPSPRDRQHGRHTRGLGREGTLGGAGETFGC